MAYRGPRGGEGWQNEAGKVRYVKDQPGRGHDHGSTTVVTSDMNYQEMSDAMRPWASGLTEKQRNMLFQWGGSGHSMRLAQAGKREQIDRYDRPWTDDDLKEWDDLLDAAPKYHGMVYRGLSNVPDSVVAQWMANGEIVLDNDQSSSRNEQESRKWFGGGIGGGADVQWRIKQRTGALVEDQTRVYYGDDPQMGAVNESEVILRQGTRYRIAGVRYIDGNGQEFPTPDTAETILQSNISGLEYQAERLRDAIQDRDYNRDFIPKWWKQDEERLTQVESEIAALKAQQGRAKLPDDFLPHKYANYPSGHYEFDLEEVPEEPVGRKVPQVETHEFQRWFGESKVVGDDGAPLVLYHGTRSDFQEFKPSSEGGGLFFTVSPDVASGYSMRYGKNPLDDQFEALRQELKGRGISEWDLARQPEWKTLQDQARLAGSAVYPVYLSVKNPFVLDGATQADEVNAIKDDPERIAELKRQGYDGILVRNANDKPGIHYTQEDAELYKQADMWVVFDPRQIKSAISNRGTYDPSNPKISESVAREAWIEYDGPRGGEGWENTETGKVAYVKEQPGQKREAASLEPATPKVPARTQPDAREVLTPEQYGEYLQRNADKWGFDQQDIEDEVARYSRRSVKDKLDQLESADYPLKLDTSPVDLRMAGSRETERVRLTPSADDLGKLWRGKIPVGPDDTIFVRHQTSPQWQREFMELGIDTRTAPPDSRLGRLTNTDKGWVQSRINEPGLFVEPNTVGDYGGPYGVILQVKAGQIKPSPESTGLGYKTGLEGLYGAKDAILAGEVIPPENVVGIYDYDHAAGKPVWIPNPRNPNSGKLRVGANGGLEMVPDAGPPASERELVFDPGADNKEIRQVKERIPGAKPVVVKLTDEEMKGYRLLYEFYKNQRSSDWERIQKIEALPSTAPVILGGTEDNRWATDGTHRLAIAAHRGQREVLAYYDSKPKKTDTPEFKQWFGNSKVVDERGKPLVLYHGTNRSFDAFDPSRQRSARNEQFQGDGFFFTEDPEVAGQYADAAANQSFDRETVMREMREQHPGVLSDLLVNMLDHGYERGWEMTLKQHGLEDARVEQWPQDLQDYGNEINDIAEWVEGSKVDGRQGDDLEQVMNLLGGGRTWMPEYVLDTAQKLGLSAPAPAVMPVYLRAEKILHTDDPEDAKTARQRGYDAVRYTGPDRVGDAAEWIVFEPEQVKSATGNRGTWERGNPKLTETSFRCWVSEPLVFEREFDETKVKRDQGGRFAEQEGRGAQAERGLPPLPETVTLGPDDEFLKDLKRYQGSDDDEFGTYEVPYQDGKKQISDEQYDRVVEINREIRQRIRLERTRGWYAEARKNLRTPAEQLTREVFAARERLKELSQLRRDRDRHGEFFKSLRDAIDREDWRAVGELNDLIDGSRSLKIVRNRYGDVLMSDKMPYAGSVWRNMNGREESLLQRQEEAGWYESDLHVKHEQLVKEAVLAGKPVSDEVLSDYWYSDWMPKERYDAYRMKDMRDRRAERVNSKEALEAMERVQPEFRRFVEEMERRGVVEKAAAVWQHEEAQVRDLMAKAEVISNERTALLQTFAKLKLKLDELEAMGPEAAAAAGFDIEARRKELQVLNDRKAELAIAGKPIGEELDNRRRLANQWFLEDVLKQMNGRVGMEVQLDAKDFPWAQQHAEYMAKAKAFLGRVAAPVMGAIRAKVVPYTNKDQRSRAGGQEMEMAEIAGPTTYVHELGHIVEDQLGLYPKSFGFLVGQVRGLPVEHMGAGYEPDEFAVKDDFRNKYAGKIYPYAATEILSMGLQELYSNPYGFAKESPRHFWFTIAALQGKLS